VISKINRCWYSVLAQLFHVSTNDTVDFVCFYTGLLPPRYLIDLCSMKYVTSLLKNPGVAEPEIFCVMYSINDVMFIS